MGIPIEFVLVKCPNSRFSLIDCIRYLLHQLGFLFYEDRDRSGGSDSPFPDSPQLLFGNLFCSDGPDGSLEARGETCDRLIQCGQAILMTQEVGM